MKYEGYVQLHNCYDLFPRLEKDFVEFAKVALEVEEKHVDPYALEDAMKLVFRNIIKGVSDKTLIIDELLKCFNDNDILAKFITTAAMLRLVNHFARMINEERPEMMHNIVNMTNAVQAFAVEFGFIKEDEIEKKVTFDEDEKPLANTITLDGGLNLYGDMFAELKEAKNKNANVVFLNLYKGVPIKSKSKIVKIEKNNATFTISPLQLEAIRKEGYAYIIQDKNITSGIQAKIASIDLATRTITLDDFSRSTKNYALMRRYPRVHPNRAISAKLFGPENTMITGKIYDISEGGIGIVSTQESTWSSGEELKATFSLDMGGSRMDITLFVVLVVALNYQGAMRYCCKVAKPQPMVQNITKFCDMRIRQTIEELCNNAQN